MLWSVVLLDISTSCIKHPHDIYRKKHLRNSFTPCGQCKCQQTGDTVYLALTLTRQSAALTLAFSPSCSFPYLRPTILTFSPVFSSSLPLLMEDGVSSPSRDTRTKSSLLRVDTESEDALIFPTEPLSSMAAAVKLSHAAHEWKTGGGGGGRWWAKSPRKRKKNNKEGENSHDVMNSMKKSIL